MACIPADVTNITACFIPSSVTWCELGDSCYVYGDTFNSDCAFTGVSEQVLSKLTASSFKCFEMLKMCIPDEETAIDNGCDIVFGKKYNYGIMSDYWAYSAIYNTDGVSALYTASVKYSPWDFLQPFNLYLWLLILTVLFILTPLVMSIVEYDEGETLLGNYIKFLPDSIHAHTGIDLVNNDLPTKNTSYILSVFVSLFAFITISLYATNLTAFVLYKNNANPFVDIHKGMKVFVEDSVYSILPLDGSVPVYFTDIPALRESGDFDYIVAENYVLRNTKTCDEVMAPLFGVGVAKYMFLARKFGEENINIMAENIRSLDFVYDTSREYCDNIAAPIRMSGIYGLFLIFVTPAVIIAIIVVIRRYITKTTSNQYIANSPQLM